MVKITGDQEEKCFGNALKDKLTTVWISEEM